MAAAHGPLHFPNISRFITEELFIEKHRRMYKIFLVSFFSGVLLFAIGMQSNILLANLQKVKQEAKERQNVVWEAAYWKGVADSNLGYRDIYHRIAILEYKLGNNEESKKYIKKALEADPNFEEAKVLGVKVGL